MIRQGNIMLRPVPAPNSKHMTAGKSVPRLVLAEGEATGHAHVIEGSVLAATAGGRALIEVLYGALTHPDHDPAPRPVPPGWYEIIQQRTFVPETRERPARTRRVQD